MKIYSSNIFVVIILGGVALLIIASMGIAMIKNIGSERSGVIKTNIETGADFSLQDLSGDTFNLAEHSSKPIFLYFWASWCAPCKSEASIIQRIWPEYEKRGYLFVGVNVWDSEKSARKFVSEYDINFPIVIDEGDTYIDYGVYALPEAFFLRENLKIDTKYIGTLSEEQLRIRLDAITK